MKETEPQSRRPVLESHFVCDQKWDEMTLTSKGRSCESCQREVIDLIGKTNEEILQILERENGRFCARYESTQVVTPVPAELNRKGRGAALRLALPALLTLGSAADSLAQSANLRVPVKKETFKPETPPFGSRSSTAELQQAENSLEDTGAANEDGVQKKLIPTDSLSTIYRGLVLDEEGVPMIGATILLVGTTNGTISDLEGRFELDLRQEELNNSSTLQLRYTGFESLDVPLTQINNGQEEVFTLVAGEFSGIYAGIVARVHTPLSTYRAPFHKRAWWKIKSAFRKKH